jgi:hypothetical protein
MTLTRKEFLNSMFGVAVGAAGAALLVACSSDDGGSADAGNTARNCTTNGTSVNIGTNHPAPGAHALVVPKEDVVAAAQKTYSIQGASTHTHNITVSAAQFLQLKTDGTASAMMTSTGAAGDGHTHVVTITCA